jgi:hypothetical protein
MKEIVMKLADFIKYENTKNKTIVKEKVEVSKKSLVNILIEMNEKKEQNLIKKKV